LLLVVEEAFTAERDPFIDQKGTTNLEAKAAASARSYHNPKLKSGRGENY